MFYYLLYNSSFAFIIDNRLFYTILYGSILYIITHAILNYCKVEILEIINNYFWFIFSLDVIALFFDIYQNLSSGISSGISSNNLDVSFNLLKNQINTINSYFNKKNDISITDSATNNTLARQPLRIPTSQYSPMQMTQQHQNIPESQNTFSTPITVIRNLDQYTPSRNTNFSNTPEQNNPVFDVQSSNISTEYNNRESIADSDVGSVIDLDDFEQTL